MMRPSSLRRKVQCSRRRQGDPDPAVQGNAGGGHSLGQHGGPGRSRYAPVEPQHEPQVQADVEQSGQGQKDQGGGRVAHRPQETGEVII